MVINKSAIGARLHTQHSLQLSISYLLLCPVVKTTIIYPATDSHIVKHSTQEVFIFDETPDDYEQKTLPYILAEQFSLDVSIVKTISLCVLDA